jgi:hypothetical protein
MNLGPLEQAITKQDIKQFLSLHKNPDDYKPFFLRDLGLDDETQGALTFFAVFTALFLAASFSMPSANILIPVCIVMLIVGIPLAVAALVIARKKKNYDIQTAIEISRLAEANGWSYVYYKANTHFAGILFTAGHHYRFTNVVNGPGFQVGQCKFKTGSGRSEREYHYAYLAIPLQRELPNMVLDSKSNNYQLLGMEISNLPETLNKDQVISLEGDFDKYYTLYAPKDYDADVRYVFTPDLMQALIRESDSIDIEILDNTMLVYLGKNDIGTIEFWQRIGRFMDIVGDKIQRQTQNYSDDKSLVSGVVAPQGRQLRRGVSTVSVVLAVLYVLLQLLDFWNKYH